MNKHSGYMEINLPDNGGVVPLKFGMWTFRELCKTWNTDLAGIQEEAKARMKTDPFTAIFDIIAPAAEYGSKGAGQTPKRPDEMTISEWIDNTGGMAGSPVIEQVMDAFTRAMGADLAPQTELKAGNSPAPEKG